MRALLDVNVLIALLDADHSLHERAREWLADHAKDGWASCAITQNGCVRIMSHASYPNSIAVKILIERLREATRNPAHEFWQDDVSLLDARAIDPTRIHGPRQITDTYLLALAVRRGGCLVTFDRAISIEAVRGATPKHLVVL
jgi:toxin-antitoxin system PIN domain toxin